MSIRHVMVVTFLGHLLNHSLTLIYPVVMIQLLQVYPETNLTTLGLLGTGHYLLYGVGAIPAGMLVDRIGARNVLLIFFLGSAASVSILILSTSLFQLGIGLAMLGLFSSLYHPAGLTLISRTSTKLSKHLGIHGIAGSLGLALGLLVGGIMATWFGWKSPFVFFGILSLLVGMVSWFMIPHSNGHYTENNPQQGNKTHLRPLIYVFIVGAFMGLSHRGIVTFLPLHFSEIIRSSLAPEIIGGSLTALVLLAGVIGQIGGGKLGGIYPRYVILPFIVGANILLLASIPLVGTNMMLVLAVIWGITHFAIQPIGNALVSDYSSPEQRGTIFGIFHGLSFGVGALASTLAGVIADQWGTIFIFTAMALILIPALIASLLLRFNEEAISID